MSQKIEKGGRVRRSWLFMAILGATIMLAACGGQPTIDPLDIGDPERGREIYETGEVSSGGRCDGASLPSQSIQIENAVDEFIAPYVDSRIFSGSVLIARCENILISKGYGMANLEHDVLNTPQTKFRSWLYYQAIYGYGYIDATGARATECAGLCLRLHA